MRARPPELAAGARAGAANTKSPGLQLRAFRRSETAGQGAGGRPGRRSEHDPHAEAEVPRVDQAAQRNLSGNLAEPVQIQRAVASDLQVGDIRSRIPEMR